MKMLDVQRPLTVMVTVLAWVSMAQKQDEELTFGDWLLKNIILILGITVLCLVCIWCVCSIHAGRAEKRAQDLRKKNREEQEEEELTIQTSLYNRQED